MPIRRVPRRFPAHDPRSWPELRDPPTGPIRRVVALHEPDDETPLYDALRVVYGRHALNPDRRTPMGRHADDDGNGVADSAEHLAELPHDDGYEPDPYTVIHPDQFSEE